MVDERAIRNAVDSAVLGINLDDPVRDYNVQSKVSEIIQDAIVAALKEYDKQK